MNCRSCNTRLPDRAGACPNCGQRQRTSTFLDSTEETPAPEDSGSRLQPLSPSSAVSDEDDDTVDIDLDEEIELPLEQAVGKRRRQESPASGQAAGKAATKGGKRADRAGQKKAAKRTSDPNESSASAAPPARKASAAADESKSDPVAFVPLDPSQIRHILAESPEILDPELSTYVDEDGNESGAQFATEVGEIDLLARNGNGEFVVVMVVEGDAGQEVVPDVLLRMGWVSKHVSGAANAGVRGMVLLEGVGDDLGYAAAAVSDRVDFRTWRMQVTFEPLPD